MVSFVALSFFTMVVSIQHIQSCLLPFYPLQGHDFLFKGRFTLSACSLIKLLFSNLLLILSVNNPTHMYLSDLRVYFKVEVYFRVT